MDDPAHCAVQLQIKSALFTKISRSRRSFCLLASKITRPHAIGFLLKRGETRKTIGLEKRQKEVPKQSKKKLEDFVNIFCKKDRVKRSPVNNKEGSFKTGKSVKIRSTEAKKEKDEPVNEKRENGRNEKKAEKSGWQNDEEERQNEILEFLKNQSRSMEENVKRMKEKMMEGIKVGNANTREFLTSEISKLKKELERKEKDWQIENNASANRDAGR
ncbi:hypothetical protein WN51_00392 [Melipona quadrifasciata]|uniref:Uncharacterized protein n=1 Tax=Melipona quadrifasciata TaxID=166423 RepID=A0A0M9A0C2_9HYME|nr:hypothetical protein WN51_00392 [Melipona quadrifasciata]